GGLSSFAVDADGEIYLCVLGQNEKATGQLLKLVPGPAAAPTAPATLSATRLFPDTELLAPAAELFPYEVNASFWSDHKQKSRWIYVPPGEPITFRSQGEWTFPAGTVAVKHFELAT